MRTIKVKSYCKTLTCPDARPIALKRFRHDENGGATLLTLYLLFIILLIASFGIDLMRQEMHRAELQANLDAAVLSAATVPYDNDPETPDAKDRLIDHFKKAGLEEALHDVEDGDIVVNAVSAKVSASASEKIDTHLMRLTGVDTMTAAAAATAKESVENIEVSLVLDISGSMRFGDRIGDLRPAAKNFISAMLPNEDREKTTSINIIPYAGQVNPGPEMFEKLGGVRYGTTGGDFFPDSTHDISHVIVYYDRDQNDSQPYDYTAKLEDYPSSERDKIVKDDLDSYIYFLDAFLRREDSDLSDSDTLVGASYKAGPMESGPHFLNGATAGFPPAQDDDVDAEYDFDDFYDEVLPQTSSCLEIDSSDFDHSGLPGQGNYEQTGHFMYWDIAANYMDWGWCPEDDTSIVYAQNDKDALRDYIDDMRLHDGTGTHYGIKYGLAALDPASMDDIVALKDGGLNAYLPEEKHGIPTDFDDRPLPWGAEDSKKFIVLMTDGKITAQYRPKEKYDPDHMINAMSNSDREVASHKSDNVSSFDQACQQAKNNGIVVYTIAFETNGDGVKQMRRCATSPSFFFKASKSSISKVFSAIAAGINQLRLTQ
ncbi:MAG: hypothetical protein GVY36_19545 [Verrucomicrobia bacterium]|jgi:Flp pilus assembly protein TadG|nr:hypothetical protein [Verrucomicrobiota bacterium]